MRILTRYILGEISSYALLGLLVFTFVIFIPHLSSLLELVVRRNLPPLGVISLFLLPVPGILVLTVPMAVLVGTLIGLSRMAADGEVIAARASGMGTREFVRPVLYYAIFGWALTSWMSLVLAPRAAVELNRMDAGYMTSQIPYEIQPRVFIEQFPNRLIYIEDVRGSRARWQGVFIADTTDRDAPKVTLAESGFLVNDQHGDGLTLQLDRGMTHEIDPQRAEQYSVSTFIQTEVPIPVNRTDTSPSLRQTPALLSTAHLIDLVTRAQPAPDRQAALVELNYRFALPVASLVLALVGLPLGLDTRKGGKAVGMMLTILLVFAYYIIMAFGQTLSKQGRLHPGIGLWMANVVFAAAGIVMLAQLRKVRARVQAMLDWFEDVGRSWASEFKRRRLRRKGPASILLQPRTPGSRMFQILDVYVIRGWLFYLLLLVVAFTGIYIVFDFFQILGDVVRNHIAPRVVLDYYRYLTPQIIFTMLPLSVLVASLVGFGLLAKTNQVTAIKSAGVSLYRISLPVLLAAAMLSAGMFLLEDQYLPALNKQQDALRNQIKGRPAQTYYRPDRQWIFGEASRIYNYSFFDPDRNVFANFSAFEFDPHTFQMKRRIFAKRAFWEEHLQRWILEDGWSRDFDRDRVLSYLPYSVATFDELSEQPPYFKKEVKTSEQMSALDLSEYIRELGQSGFDVVRLSIQLYRKFSYPVMTLIVGLIGIPFAFSMGRKGALTGVALSIGIAIVYWSSSSLFEAMGNLHQLPPAMAAWSPDVLFGLGGIYFLLRIKT
ncbi:MAG TPA: LptF/LptG family permease [Terriglobia bacterium]|nr:LptF/LptG family permease [Terriglobia bacterium]